MKTNRTSFLFFAALLCGLLFSACGSGKPEIIQVDPAFSQYISAYSSGMQSRTANVRIQLEDVYNDDVLASIKRDSLGMPDSTLLKDIFSFEPEVAGHAIWADNHTVEFVPDEVLPVNQFFDVHFDLERIAKVKDGYDDFHFQFATYHQDLFVEVDGLYDSGDYDLDWKRLRGTIRTTDFEDTALFRQALKIVQNGKSLRYTLEPGYDEYQYFFEVDSIERKEQAGKVTVSWDGTPIHAFKSGSQDLEIPALGDFSVSNAKVMDNGDQYVELQFSEPIAQQYLDGIVTLDGVDKLTYTISYNLVTVYLPNRLVGTHTLKVTDGVRNIKGHRMLKAYSNELLFEEPKPLVRIKGNGSILPSSNGLIFPFEAISLKAVDVRIVKIYENNIHHFLQVNNLDGDDNLTRFGKVIVKKKIALDYDKSMDLKQWNSHVLDLNKLIKADPGAIYRVSIKFSKEYAVCDCPVDENAPAETDESDNGSYEDVDPEWNENTWHGYGFDDGFDSWYSYGDDYSACDNYYYEGKAVSRNILASDLGVIFKLDEDKLSHAFVSDLITTNPVPNATVEYFDFTKQLIASGTTDANGMLDIQLKQKPFLMITKRGSQRGYMKLGDGYTNSLSEFDIEGETVQNGVKGFIYGERGVWRPGDSLYLTFILQDLQHKLPENHPVKFALQDPNGQTVYETTKVKHVNSMYDFRTMTSDNAPTGDYTAIVRVGNRVFTKTLRIETVKPNRLKIYMNVENVVTGDSTKLSVKWLHGAPAKHLRATVSVKVNPMTTTFPNYKSYVFDSPMRSCKSDVEQVFEGYLDDNGESWVNTRLNSVSSAPGMLRAHYITRVYEEGGDFSIDRSSVNYSPFKTYVGIRIPEPTHGDGSLETDQNHKIDIVAVNEKGTPVTVNDLQVKVYKLQWRWWYEQDDEDLAEYMARTGTIVLEDTILNAKNGKATFNFRVKAPEYGRYLVTVTDPAGEHQTGQIITVDLPYWNRGNRMDNEHANMLSFSCDKQTYTKGENIQLSFPSPADGHALVSVETSRKVVKKFWIKTVKGETKYEFPATADMSPNAFIHVTMIQPHATTKNDLPIRMYGVVPVMVDDPETHIHPEIAMADAVRPESTVSVKVSEQNGRKMTYTLEIVDDGLLDLTAFKTPQPWNTFYAREALGVRTWDMYDHVIGAYAGKLDKLLSIGGDGDLDGAKGPKANRFKPMVIHLGPFELEPGQAQTHKVEIPNYVGSVRVMVVAHNDGAYGNAEKTVAVKKPLMVLATLPRVLGPGEQVQLPVDVFAMEKQIKDVKVTVEVNDMLVLSGAKQQAVTFTQIGDQVLNFKLNVAERIGIAKVKVTAICGNEKAVQEIELDVRAPNPTVFEGKEMVLEPGKEWNTDLYFKGMTGTNKATIEFSSVPSMGLEKRLNYLLEYPHGCIEQTTSAAFPQLYVNRLMDLNEQQQLRSSENIKAALRRLQLFQTSDGGFSYWPGEGDESEWGTNYAGHFLVEAEEQGYSLPGNMKERWVKYEQQMARNYDPANGVWAQNTTEIIQAYRLFVLALSKNPEAGAMNRLREVRNLSATAKWRLAAAYELIGQKEVAQKLTDQLPTSVAAYKELSYTYGSDTRDQAMILETLSLMGNKTRTGNLAKEIAAKLSSDQWMSTQETAYSLLAMCEYAGLKTGHSALNFSCSVNGAAVKKGTTTKSIYQVGYTDKDFAKRGSLACKNTGNSTLFVKVMVQGTPLVGDQSSAAKDLVLKLKFRDMNGKEIKPDKLAQGTDFVAEVTITNPGKKGWYKEMALTQIFPSGWEIHNARMDGGGYSTAARYEDIRDDRVYSYYDLGPNESKAFKVQLNATYLGRFYLPTTYSDAMYDHWINARVPGKWVEVFKEKS